MLGEMDHKQHLLPLLKETGQFQKRPKAGGNEGPRGRQNRRSNGQKVKPGDLGDIVLTFHTLSDRPEGPERPQQGRRKGQKAQKRQKGQNKGQGRRMRQKERNAARERDLEGVGIGGLKSIARNFISEVPRPGEVRRKYCSIFQ